jgi:hypothetical protein
MAAVDARRVQSARAPGSSPFGILYEGMTITQLEVGMNTNTIISSTISKAQEQIRIANDHPCNTCRRLLTCDGTKPCTRLFAYDALRLSNGLDVSHV